MPDRTPTGPRSTASQVSGKVRSRTTKTEDFEEAQPSTIPKIEKSAPNEVDLLRRRLKSGRHLKEFASERAVQARKLLKTAPRIGHVAGGGDAINSMADLQMIWNEADECRLVLRPHPQYSGLVKRLDALLVDSIEPALEALRTRKRTPHQPAMELDRSGEMSYGTPPTGFRGGVMARAESSIAPLGRGTSETGTPKRRGRPRKLAQPIRKIQVAVTEDTFNGFERVQQALGAASYPEVMRRMLRFAHWCLLRQAEGYEFIADGKRGLGQRTMAAVPPPVLKRIPVGLDPATHELFAEVQRRLGSRSQEQTLDQLVQFATWFLDLRDGRFALVPRDRSMATRHFEVVTF